MSPNLGIRLTIDSIDYDTGLLTIKRSKKKEAPPVRLNLIPDEIVGAKVIVTAIEDTVRQYRELGSLPQALSDLLHRRKPRITGHGEGSIVRKGENIAVALSRAVLGLDGSTLCVQGPPGAGKTSKGGAVIAELLKAGKRVGITSNSHNAICLLMNSAITAAAQSGVRYTSAKGGGDPECQTLHPSIELHSQGSDVFKGDLAQLVGGTAWLFSREEARGRFDYLFVDEASQVSLANIVSMAACATNLVLLGDQMQLGQPIQGSHPGESGQSILEYYLQGQATVAPDMGIFLPTTWRMRPEICSFISEGIYEGRLTSEDCTKNRSIHFQGEARLIRRSAGLIYVPVQHSYNTCESEEECQVIQQIVSELCGHKLTIDGQERFVCANDILVVAPFNLQVRRIKSALPQVRVGTVDKFQGEQAPIVIFSMTASEGDSSPRGIDFLFDKHRMNVAISRAQVMAVIVGSPTLERTRCSSLRQMAAVNLYCRAVQQGSVEVSANIDISGNVAA